MSCPCSALFSLPRRTQSCFTMSSWRRVGGWGACRVRCRRACCAHAAPLCQRARCPSTRRCRTGAAARRPRRAPVCAAGCLVAMLAPGASCLGAGRRGAACTFQNGRGATRPRAAQREQRAHTGAGALRRPSPAHLGVERRDLLGVLAGLQLRGAVAVRGPHQVVKQPGHERGGGCVEALAVVERLQLAAQQHQRPLVHQAARHGASEPAGGLHAGSARSKRGLSGGHPAKATAGGQGGHMQLVVGACSAVIAQRVSGGSGSSAGAHSARDAASWRFWRSTPPPPSALLLCRRRCISTPAAQAAHRLSALARVAHSMRRGARLQSAAGGCSMCTKPAAVQACVAAHSRNVQSRTRRPYPQLVLCT